MEWRRIERGEYEATDNGDHWRISQTASKRWEIFRNGREVEPSAHSLSDAKLYVKSDRRKERADALADAAARYLDTGRGDLDGTLDAYLCEKDAAPMLEP